MHVTATPEPARTRAPVPTVHNPTKNSPTPTSSYPYSPPPPPLAPEPRPPRAIVEAGQPGPLAQADRDTSHLSIQTSRQAEIFDMTIAPRQPRRKNGSQPPTAVISRATAGQITDSKNLPRNWHCSANELAPAPPRTIPHNSAESFATSSQPSAVCPLPGDPRPRRRSSAPIWFFASERMQNRCATPRTWGSATSRRSRWPMQQMQRTATRYRKNGARTSRAKNPDAWRQGILRSEPNPTCSKRCNYKQMLKLIQPLPRNWGCSASVPHAQIRTKTHKNPLSPPGPSSETGVLSAFIGGPFGFREWGLAI